MLDEIRPIARCSSRPMHEQDGDLLGIELLQKVETGADVEEELHGLPQTQRAVLGRKARIIEPDDVADLNGRDGARAALSEFTQCNDWKVEPHSRLGGNMQVQARDLLPDCDLYDRWCSIKCRRILVRRVNEVALAIDKRRDLVVAGGHDEEVGSGAVEDERVHNLCRR